MAMQIDKLCFSDSSVLSFEQQEYQSNEHLSCNDIIDTWGWDE